MQMPAKNRETKTKLNINDFQRHLEEEIILKVSLKNEQEINKAAEKFTETIQRVTQLTSVQIYSQYSNDYSVSREIRELIALRRYRRRIWQASRHPSDEYNFSKPVKN